MGLTFDAAPGIRAIDTVMCGRRQVTSAYLVEADEPALIETGPATSAPAVVQGLDALGVGPDDLAHIVVTHIHLDHAGGAGTLAPRYPRAKVWVHERGARHLEDPTKLVASAERIYGAEELARMFGRVEPVPADRLQALADGDRISLGNRELGVHHTPGHAGHHVALLDSDSSAVFVGDAMGVFLPDVRVLRPATPPPEFDLELAVGSIERIRALEPSSILFSHFGPAAEVGHLCELAIARLRKWTGAVARALEGTDDLDAVTQQLRESTADELRPVSGEGLIEIQDRYELLSSYRMNAMGLMRYLRQDSAASRSATS